MRQRKTQKLVPVSVNLPKVDLAKLASLGVLDSSGNAGSQIRLAVKKYLEQRMSEPETKKFVDDREFTINRNLMMLFQSRPKE